MDENSVLWCGHCSDAIQRKQAKLLCDGVCGCYIHMDCADVTKEQILMIEEHDNIQFWCHSCKTNSIKSVNNKIDGIYELLYRLEKKVDALQSVSGVQHAKPGSKQESYASVASSISNKCILIRPKSNTTDSKTTKQTIRASIDPTTVKVNTVKSISKGGVAVECCDSNAMLKLKKIAIEKLGNDFEIEVAKKRDPWLKIVGIEKEIETDQQICNMLKAQNEHLTNDNDIKIIRKYVVKDKYATAIVQMSVNSFEACMDNGKVNIGWSTCKVYEEVPLRMCIKCCEYGHIAKDCVKETVCKKCGGAHMMSECTVTTLKCRNCDEANKKYNFGLNTEHMINDVICGTRQKRLQIVKRNIRGSQ